MSFAPENCDEPALLSIAVLAEMANPFEDPCWPGLSRSLSMEEVEDAISAGRLIAPSADSGRAAAPRAAHVSRIAWFAVHGWRDPISVDIGVPGFAGFRSCWPILDGNHRFAAAIFRGNPTILAEFGGSITEAARLGLFVDAGRIDGML